MTKCVWLPTWVGKERQNIYVDAFPKAMEENSCGFWNIPKFYILVWRCLRISILWFSSFCLSSFSLLTDNTLYILTLFLNCNNREKDFPLLELSQKEWKLLPYSQLRKVWEEHCLSVSKPYHLPQGGRND